MPRSPYGSLYERLVANTAEPANEQACWLWKGSRLDRRGYARTTLYVPGLGKTVSLFAHVLMYVLMNSEEKTADDAWLAYQELRTSQLEVDHLCVSPACCGPDHLEAVTSQENSLRRGRRA